jgi:hypothetical protein
MHLMPDKQACYPPSSEGADDAARITSASGVAWLMRCLASVALTITLSLCAAHAAQKSKFEEERLSAKGRVAYQRLFSADIFRVGGVGYSGETSEEELALYVLLSESEAIEALQSLVSDGSYEGGLYGLLGLSVTDVGKFNRAVEVYKSREPPPERRMSQSFIGLSAAKGKVIIQSGCIIEADDWLKVVSNIQSGRYDRILQKERG